MIKNFKLFEAVSKDLAPYQKLKAKEAQELVKILGRDINWDKMDSNDFADLEKKTGLKAGEIINLHIAVNQDPGVISAFRTSYAKGKGVNDWSEALRLKESDKFKSDEDIAAEFSNMRVEEFTMPGNFTNKQMGQIVLEFPDGDEHVAGGSSTSVEDFIYNDKTNEFRIAFQNWYPEEVAMEITNEVKKRIQEATNKPVKQIRYAADWSDEESE